MQQSILVDETSSNGLFNHFVNCQAGTDRAHVPLLCIDEGYTFLQKLISTSKSASQTSLTMERTCKLYDGDYWYTVKGKRKRAGVQSARMSMSTFTTPRRFLTEIWPRVVASRKGLADRILVLCQEWVQRDMEEIEMFSTQLVQESAVQSLGTVYLTIILRNRAEYRLILSRRGRRHFVY